MQWTILDEAVSGALVSQTVFGGQIALGAATARERGFGSAEDAAAQLGQEAFDQLVKQVGDIHD